MASKFEQIRTKLQNKLFDVYGKTVTLKNPDTPTTNSRGEIESTTYTEYTNIKVVPYDILSDIQGIESFGVLQEGEMDIAVPYDTPVQNNSIFVIEGVSYQVTRLGKNWLPENVVFIVRVTKTLDSS